MSRERPRWTSEQIAVFDSVQTRLRPDGEVGLQILQRVELLNDQHSDLLFWWDIGFDIPEWKDWSRLYACSPYPEDIEKPTQYFIAYTGSRLAVRPLTHDQLCIIGDCADDIRKSFDFRFIGRYKTEESYRNQIFLVYYSLNPWFGSSFWNPNSVDFRRKR